MAASARATTRLKRDFVSLMKEPVPLIVAAPLPSNILQWHYVVCVIEEAKGIARIWFPGAPSRYKPEHHKAPP